MARHRVCSFGALVLMVVGTHAAADEVDIEQWRVLEPARAARTRRKTPSTARSLGRGWSALATPDGAPANVRLEFRFTIEKPVQPGWQTGHVVSPFALGAEQREEDCTKLADRMLAILIRGLSTRNYREVLPEMAERVGISKSQVSRENIEAVERLLRVLAERVSGGGGAADPAAIGHHGHARQLRDVLRAISKGTSPAIDGAEGRRSVEIILAIYKAAETGRAIQLPLKNDPVLKARKTGVGA